MFSFFFPSNKPLDPEQLEYRRWLVEIEKKAILPIKWLILFGSAFLWQWRREWLQMPHWTVFGLFFTYLMCNLGFTYLFLLRKPNPGQAKFLCLTSYLIDLVFVTLLIYLDALLIFLDTRMLSEPIRLSDFFVLYFVMILRGFSLFENRKESMILSLLILSLFVFSAWLTRRDFSFMQDRVFGLQIFLVWLVILISWFIVEVIRGQQVALTRVRENLVRTESLAMIGEMASGVAHEINNPIGIISAYAEFMLRQSKEDDPHREDFMVMADEAQRCKKIVSELLHFSRPAKKEIDLINICELNDEVLRFVFLDSSKAKISVVKDYTDPGAVQLDPSQIKQALVNIYLNARQAMQEQGEIKIRISPADLRNGQFSIEISDSGPGMTDEEMRRAFEPFYTNKERGTGLGLSITQRIVENHNGQIALSNNSSRPGLTIKLTLPLIAPFTSA